MTNLEKQLLAALEALMEDYEDNTVGDLDNDDLNVPSALKEARAAIKAATGNDHA